MLYSAVIHEFNITESILQDIQKKCEEFCQSVHENTPKVTVTTAVHDEATEKMETWLNCRFMK